LLFFYTGITRSASELLQGQSQEIAADERLADQRMCFLMFYAEPARHNEIRRALASLREGVAHLSQK